MFEDLKEKFEILIENIISPDIKQFYVNQNDIKQVLNYLKDSPIYLYERLDCIYAKDTGNIFEITYILNSDKYISKCAISCNILYKSSQIVSVCDIFKNANWEEREIYDLFGIKFINHPNLERILLPNSFIGHPLQKSYKNRQESLKWNYE